MMSKENNGGLAFPRPMSVSHGGFHEHQEVIPPEEGMTLRDYFAAKAMQGFLTNRSYDDSTIEKTSEAAYKMAGVMLKEREK